jgi:hypothetical protein
VSSHNDKFCSGLGGPEFIPPHLRIVSARISIVRDYLLRTAARVAFTRLCRPKRLSSDMLCYLLILLSGINTTNIPIKNPLALATLESLWAC